MAETTIDTLIIDGTPITDYSDYYVLNELTYSQQPSRSINGVMDDLERIPSYNVPRLFVSFRYLNTQKFRNVLSAITRKKQFDITYYDIYDGNCYTKQFYLTPLERAKIFTRIDKNSNVIFEGIRDFSIELNGTLRETLNTEDPSEESSD